MNPHRFSTAVFVGLIFTSAALVFSVQPIVGRMLLPRLGGTTIVWNTCLVFFQAALLGGYFYADILSRKLPLKAQIPTHLLALVAAGVFLPISFAGEEMPSDAVPAIWLLGELTLAVGLPFLVISASAPLFQSWFARTGLPSADNPYQLYAASNLGSILSLVAYPFVLEPRLGVDDQSKVWAMGYGALILIVFAAGLVTWRLSESTGLRDAFKAGHKEEAPLRTRLTWGYLAFVPSALLVAVSAHITADVAPVPFLWMVPLVLFLLTFVIAFSRWQVLSIGWLAAVAIPAAFVVAYGLAIQNLYVARFIELNVFAFFLVALLFHMSLAHRKPAPSQLTNYYLMMSLGGVLGGAFTALLAPLVFDGLWEYPLLLVVAMASLPLLVDAQTWQKAAKVVLVVLVACIGVYVVTSAANAPLWYKALMAALTVGSVVAVFKKPALFGLGIAVIVFVNMGVATGQRDLLYAGRSYFGAYEVERKVQQDGEFILLHHGSTLHGRQSTDKELSRYPLEYYATDKGVGRVFAEMDKRSMPQNIGAIGLGIGSIAAYIHPKRTADFYEIDPLVYEIAKNPKYFTYLPACGERCNVLVGDGRIEISKMPDASYDLVVLDAFNSDAVPVHLLTAEAIDLYFKKLKPNGLLALHLTNGYLRLPEVAAKIAMEGGYVHMLIGQGITWMVMARDPADFGSLVQLEDAWYVPQTDLPLWTDDFADILGSIKR